MPPDAAVPARPAFTPRGSASNSIRHFGQVPRECSRMSGCIGQTYATVCRPARLRVRARWRAERARWFVFFAACCRPC